MSLLDKLDKFKKSQKKEVQEAKKIEKIITFPEPKKSIERLIESVEKESYNKSIELNSIKTIYANRFGTSTDKLLHEMRNAIINAWKK